MRARGGAFRSTVLGQQGDGVKLRVVYQGEHSETLVPVQLGLEAVSLEVERESLAGRIPVGALVKLRFTGEREKDVHSIYCRCEERRELLRTVYVVYRYEGTDEQMKALLQMIEAMFNRRGAFRVKPPLHKAPKCYVSLKEAQVRREGAQEARLEDLSATGCGLLLSVVAEKELAENRFIEIRFQHEGRDVVLDGEVVYRMLRRENVRYGVRFSATETDSAQHRQLMLVIMAWQRSYLNG